MNARCDCQSTRRLTEVPTNRIVPIGCPGEHVSNGSVDRGRDIDDDMERSKQECSELFRQCVQVLNEYESETSERAFLETFFQCNHVCSNRECSYGVKNVVAQVSNQALVSAVLHDCLRHGALVRIIVNAFAVSDDIDLRQPEENIYRGSSVNERSSSSGTVRCIFSDYLCHLFPTRFDRTAALPGIDHLCLSLRSTAGKTTERTLAFLVFSVSSVPHR